MLPALGARRRIASLSCTDMPKLWDRAGLGPSLSTAAPSPPGSGIPASPTGGSPRAGLFLAAPRWKASLLPPPAQPMGAAPARALPTISSSATPRTALMRWPTSVRSSAGSGTCTSSMVTLNTTGCPTSTGMVSPGRRGHSVGGPGLAGPLILHGRASRAHPGLGAHGRTAVPEKPETAWPRMQQRGQAPAGPRRLQLPSGGQGWHCTTSPSAAGQGQARAVRGIRLPLTCHLPVRTLSSK